MDIDRAGSLAGIGTIFNVAGRLFASGHANAEPAAQLDTEQAPHARGGQLESHDAHLTRQ